MESADITQALCASFIILATAVGTVLWQTRPARFRKMPKRRYRL